MEEGDWKGKEINSWRGTVFVKKVVSLYFRHLGRLTLMKRYILLIISILCLLFPSCGKQGKVDDMSIIPEPVFAIQKGEHFTLSRKTHICFENIGQNSDIARYVSQSFRKMRIRPVIIGTPEKNCLTLSINRTRNIEIGDEGYQLDIDPDGITISANTEAGLFYGFQSLRQILPDDIVEKRYRRIELPECTLLDYPRFEWRGIMMDECHHFQKVSEVKKTLQLMAAHKMNRLILTIQEGNVWRLNMDAMPEYESVDVWSGDELKELSDYAREMHITLVPGIDLSALSRYSDDPVTIEAICDEVMRLIPSGYLHVGAIDSVASPTLSHLERHLGEQGCRMICWMPEAIDSLSPSTILMPRHSTNEALRALQHGHDVVMCQEEFCNLYNDQCNAAYVQQPTGVRLPLAKVYRYTPMPSGINDNEKKHILGAQALMLTHNITSQKRLEYTLLPRLCAFAEDLWTPSKAKDWSRFRRKIEQQKDRLASRGYTCCAGSFQPSILQTHIAGGQLQVMLEAEVFGTHYHYTTDGTEPDMDAPVYSGALTLTKGTLLRVQAYYRGKFREGIYEFVIQ